MVAISSVLLVGCLFGFFWLNEIVQTMGIFGVSTVGDDIILATLNNFQIAVSMSALRVLLAGGSVFFQFIIIVRVMSDRIFDSLRVLIRPLIMLVPISVFVLSAFRTFEPIIRSLLPPELGGENPDYIASVANSETLARSVLITFGAMLFYLVLSAIMGDNSSAEIRNLRAELRRCRERQRQG